MQELILAQTDKLTMDSEAIADALQLRHDNVRQAAISLKTNGIITFTETSVKGAGRPKQVMHFDKRNSFVIAAKLNDKLLGNIIDRWLELEAKEAPVPAALSRKDLAMMVIESETAREEAEQEVERLQGVCNTIAAQFAPGMTAPKFCKQLNGVNTQEVTNKLINMNVLAKNASGVVPTSYGRDRYFAEKQEEHNDKVRSKSILTMKGAKWLYRCYLSNKLPMKKSWDGNFSHITFGDDS